MKTEIKAYLVSYTESSFKDSKTGSEINFAFVLLRPEDGNLYRVSAEVGKSWKSLQDKKVIASVEFFPSADKASRLRVFDLKSATA